MKTRKSIISHIIVTIVCFLIVAFVKWDIIWLKELPKYDMETRGAGIFCFFVIHFFVEILTHNPRT